MNKAVASEDSASPLASTSSSFNRPPESVFWGAAVIGFLWFLALGWLTFTTANPVTLNIAQLKSAPLIIVAKAVDISQGQIEVQEALKGPSPDNLSQVRQLEVTGAEPGSTYIIPLERSAGGRWQVAAIPDGRRLVYPAEEQVVEKCRDILATME
ncbi:MAG: hypothetical protein KDA80_11595 [Planctomycetaceae bacterium]|nr:hypothetical protein [Planctomycetaceae bacterium]